MKNIIAFGILLITAFGISSCGCDTGLSVDEYITENNLTTQELDEGVHIIINNSGNGQKPPNLDTKVTVNYVGTLTDGTEFDSGQGIEFLLRNVIRGWQIGLRAMSKGGSATIVIPSSAGYGSSESGNIPCGSTLIFEVDLVDF